MTKELGITKHEWERICPPLVGVIFQPLLDLGLPKVPVVAVVFFEEEFEVIFGFACFRVIWLPSDRQEHGKFDSVGTVERIAEEHFENSFGHFGIGKVLAQSGIILVSQQVGKMAGDFDLSLLGQSRK